MNENLNPEKLLEHNPIDLLNQYVLPWLDNIVMAILIYVIGRWIATLLVKLSRKLMTKAKVDPLLVNFIGSMLGGLLTLVVIIASLDRLGVNTTSLIALIGAAGLAIGLALQGTLANFASGVLLIVFKPFKVGDFVEAGGVSGVIEEIRIFNTMFRTGDNKEMIVPNGQIYGGTIVNYSARATRRIDLTIGIGYDADIKLAKETLNALIKADERILADPAPVIAVSELADSSVNFVVRPWVKSGDYWGVYWDLLESVKLTFDEKGISIPYPQMDVHVDGVSNAA
jgi:small conductance mechanosensitive channel